MSLYRNINKRKKAGTSRSKSKSTISAKAYRNMKAGFPNSKAKRKAKEEKIMKKTKSKKKLQDLVAIKKIDAADFRKLRRRKKKINAIARI